MSKVNLLRILDSYEFTIVIEAKHEMVVPYETYMFCLGDDGFLLSDEYLVCNNYRIEPSGTVRQDINESKNKHRFRFNLNNLNDSFSKFVLYFQCRDFFSFIDFEEVTVSVVSQGKQLLSHTLPRDDFSHLDLAKLVELEYKDQEFSFQFFGTRYFLPRLPLIIEQFSREAPRNNKSNSCIDRIQAKKDISEGKINAIAPNGIVIKHGEILLHQEFNAVLLSPVDADPVGNLYMTNERLIFKQKDHPLEIKMNNIFSVELDDGQLLVVTNKKSFQFSTSDNDLSVMLGNFATSLYHRQIEFFTADPNTKKIPQTVRTVVWYRDSGKCVQCGSGSYLEFDHIIPRSKGGSNGEANIQLLCRSCNGKKAAKI